MKKHYQAARYRLRNQARIRFAGLFEKFEERLPLTGPYFNSPISESQADYFINGTRGLSELGGRIDRSNEFAEQLGPFKNTDGTPMTAGLLGPFGRTLREELENPIRDYFNNTPAAQRSTDSLVAHLGTFGTFVSIEGGLLDGSIDEIVFDVHIQRTFDADLLDLEFDHDQLPSPFKSKSQLETNLRATVDFEFVFGITLDAALNDQQAFFVRDVSFSSAIELDTILDPFTVNFGFLEASVPDVLLAANLQIEVSQPAITPTLRLTELDTFEVEELFTTQIGTNNFDATFDLDVGLGRWSLEATSLRAAGNFLGFDPVLTFSPNFDEIFLFDHISSAELVAGMEEFQSWLTSFGNSEHYDVAIPFTKDSTAGSVFNAGASLRRFINGLRDEQGNPTFDNAADFPYAASGLDYDPVTNKLRFAIIEDFASKQTQSRSSRIELDDVLGLSSQTPATITADGSVGFVVSIDLTQDGIGFLDRIAIENLRVQTTYDTSGAVSSGNAAFGGLGFSYADSVLSGAFSAEAVFRSSLGGQPITLQVLRDSIDTVEDLLRGDLTWNGTSRLVTPVTQITGGLFAIPTDAIIEVQVTDILNSIYETTTNVSDFWNFEDLTFESLVNSFSEAILGTQDWDNGGDDALAPLDISLDAIGQLEQDRIDQTIQSSLEDAELSPGQNRQIIQDIPRFVEDLPLSSSSGASFSLTSDLVYRATSGLLEFSSSIERALTTSIQVGLGFESLFDATQNDKIRDTSDLVGPLGSTQATTTTSLQLELEFDPSGGNQPQIASRGFVKPQSRIDRALYINALANADPIRISGASGALGLNLRQGSLIVAQDLLAPDPSRPAIFTTSIPASHGRVPINALRTFLPERTSQGRLLADFEVVPDHTGTSQPDRLRFRTLDFANPGGSSGVLSSPDFVQLRQGVDLQVNLNAFIPSFEDALATLRDRIVQEVLNRIYPLIGDKLEEFADFIEPFRDEITRALRALNSFSVSDIENAIETALKNLFNRPNADFVRVDINTPTVFKLTLDIENAPISVRKTTNSNLGVPALGADWSSEFSVVGAYEFQMTFALDLNDGFYIETNTETVQLTLDMDMVGQATGKLGFFEVIATAQAPQQGQSAFRAQYVIDVTEPSGDDRLFLHEIGTGTLIDTRTSGLSGQASLVFTIEANATAWLPSIRTGLRIDWAFDGFGFNGSIPKVTYEGMQLKLGGLLTEVFLPFFETLKDVFEPIEPAIDLLTQPLPVISELVSPPPSILDLAEAISPTLPPNIQSAVDSLIEFVRTLEQISQIVLAINLDTTNAWSVYLDLGDIQFGGLTSPQFDVRLPQLDPGVLNLAEIPSPGDLRTQFDLGAVNLSGILETSPGALRLPIIEDPLSAIGWLLGVGQATLITWDLPNASFKLPIGLEFPVFPGILAGIFGGLELGFDFKVGLDTKGFDAYSKSRDPKDFFQGFYVSDRANADGTGPDINEVFIRGDLLAAAGIGVPGVSLLIGGGVFSEVGIDLIDHDQDGKVRGKDFTSNAGCFALNGEFGVALEARAKLGGIPFELPITEVTLARGRKVIGCPFVEPEPPAILGGLDANGTLTLYIGPEAFRRDVRPNVEEEFFTVTQSTSEVIVSAFGKSQRFAANDVLTIIADGGSKDDRIVLVGVNKPAILRGGDGDDVILGGELNDFIDGGQGRDELSGSGGKDTIVGGLDDDLIYGDSGNDDLFGQDGNDEIHGGLGNDSIETGNGLNIAFGDEGDDSIVGGIFPDLLYGGPDADTIQGGAGNDTILGESGSDTIRGGPDDDTIDGGSEGDFLFGDDGLDRIYGRTGIDRIFGGLGQDLLSGNEDDDSIFGQEDADEIYGDAGNDTIEGGPSDDLIFGGAGEDEIFGGAGNDTIYGGAEGDSIDGQSGNDILDGQEGQDTLSGNSGDDVIYGGPDPDTIYGYNSSQLAESLPPGISDRDLIYGGLDADLIAGGPDDDLIYGEQGDDTLLGNEGSDTIYGQDGRDRIFGFHFKQPESWYLLTGGSDQADFLFGDRDDDQIHGGPGGDDLRGNLGDDTLFGDEGSDVLNGGDDDDTLDGGEDPDILDGGLGNDHLIGGLDDDALYGNRGSDLIEGNQGADFIAGNDQPDFVYGDEGSDRIFGGDGNDTLRGGDQDDTIHGDQGDDLILGHHGADTLMGDEGNDVIYGGDQADSVRGGLGDDRIYGERGADTLMGDQGDDVVEGGDGDDTLFGGDGDDALYGDADQDTISGGQGNDYLFAGDGVSNTLKGDQGNDTLVGSDEGSEDPKPQDNILFGDRLSGDEGDDTILGLGGSDIIDGGIGNNTIDGGVHTDIVTNGTDLPGVADFQLPSGPDRRGRFSQLSRSASFGGLSNVGGFEEAVYVDHSGVYVAWVDWRNGNSEIYVAHHPHGVGQWSALAGFGSFDSASGGGISNDENQSRRPTLLKTESSDSLVVAWTSIAADGTSNIEVARQDQAWDRLANPAQSGRADYARFVQHSDFSGLLFWVETNPISGERILKSSQYVYSETPDVEVFLPEMSPYTPTAGRNLQSYDVASTEFQAVLTVSHTDGIDHDIVVRKDRAVLRDESFFLPGVPNVSFREYVSGRWETIHQITQDNTLEPTIGIQYLDQIGSVPGEIELIYNVAVAWETVSSRENQVDGLVLRVDPNLPLVVQPMIPQYQRDPSPRFGAQTVSDTLGYADKPDLAMGFSGTYLGWRDDGVFGGDGRSSIYVMGRFYDPTLADFILSEEFPDEASGLGIAESDSESLLASYPRVPADIGGSLRDLELAMAEDFFGSGSLVVLWNEARSTSSLGRNNVYLRTSLDGLEGVDDSRLLRKFGQSVLNVLENDRGLFGEFLPRLTHFDGRELQFLPETGDEVIVSSLLGARIVISANGRISYDPNGAAAFRNLKRSEFLKESFVYCVDNGIHRAEAIVEFVVFGTNVWRNERDPFDVNDDGFTGPLDVLLLINDINTNGSRRLDDIGPGIKKFLDVDDDGFILPLDVLNVINLINSRSGSEGETARVVQGLALAYDDLTDWREKQRRNQRR
jgi:Ca2+-binding RTX toxin-like protein